MSRAKVGYEFCPLPRKLNAVWAGSSMYVRGLLWSLFELNDGGPIQVTGTDWLESVCKQLVINGRDRPNVRKALLEFQAKGAVNVSSGRVTIAFLPHDQLTPNDVHATANASDSTSTVHQSHVQAYVPPESNPCNDSGHKSQTDRRERTEERESDARPPARSSDFEKPPVGEAPPNVPPSASAVPSWLAAWKVVESVTDKTGMLGHPGRHQEWLQQLAAAAEREVTCQTSPSFPEATERLVRAWMADPWVIKNDADIGNMGVWLRKRKPPTTKPIVPVRLRDRDLTDTELLAIDEFEEGELDVWQKQRRWELQARRDSADSRKLRAIVGGAS